MFYCNTCADRHGWPQTIYKSEGRCEMCGEHAVCNDTPSRLLPSAKPKKGQ